MAPTGPPFSPSLHIKKPYQLPSIFNKALRSDMLDSLIHQTTILYK
jgi:hypothetical protein